MGIYQDALLEEQPLYGSSRLGSYQGGRLTGERRLGLRHYELSNHLGNVLATVSDNIQLSATQTLAKTLSTADYHPFGLQMEGRTVNFEKTRYGYNGKELDGDFANNYDYGFRIYNPGVARFLSVDPLAKSFPWYTPYQFAGNKPIWAIDLDGAEEKIHHTDVVMTKGSTTQFQMTGVFRTDVSPTIKDGRKAYALYTRNAQGGRTFIGFSKRQDLNDIPEPYIYGQYMAGSGKAFNRTDKNRIDRELTVKIQQLADITELSPRAISLKLQTDTHVREEVISMNMEFLNSTANSIGDAADMAESALEIEAGVMKSSAFRIVKPIGFIGYGADVTDFLSSGKATGDYVDFGVSSGLFVAGFYLAPEFTVPAALIWLIIKNPVKDEINKATGEYTDPKQIDKKVYDDSDNK